MCDDELYQIKDIEICNRGVNMMKLIKNLCDYRELFHQILKIRGENIKKVLFRNIMVFL